MADPSQLQQAAVPTWQWLASVGAALLTLLTLIGLQRREGGLRGKADEKITALELRCTGLHDSLAIARNEIAVLRTAMVERCEKLELAVSALQGKLRTQQAVCDERHPKGRKQMSDSHDEPGGART
jgi:hypothetical protein